MEDFFFLGTFADTSYIFKVLVSRLLTAYTFLPPVFGFVSFRFVKMAWPLRTSQETMNLKVSVNPIERQWSPSVNIYITDFI